MLGFGLFLSIVLSGLPQSCFFDCFTVCVCVCLCVLQEVNVKQLPDGVILISLDGRLTGQI